MIYVIAGEASGDLHTANLISDLKKRNSSLVFRGMGGEKMQAAGVDIKFSYKDIAIMGFWEVFTKRKSLKALMSQVVQDIIDSKPDKLLLVDSSGFNLRIAKRIRAKIKIEIHYYIAPKIWAWAEWRINKIKTCVDYLYCILPFEEPYFRGKGFEKAFYVGNPTVKEIEGYSFKPLDLELKEEEKILALLPGSRKQEIDRLLPNMLEAAMKSDFDRIIIAAAQGFDESYYQNYIGETEKNLNIVFGETWDLLKRANAAVITSGTATLEAALIGCPQVVVYKTSGLSYFLGRRLVKVKYISLVNLILNRLAVKELIQHKANPADINSSLMECNALEANEIKSKLEDRLQSNANLAIIREGLS